MGTLQWLGDVEDRMVRREYVTPAERIAQKVRRACVDQGGGWRRPVTRRTVRRWARKLERRDQHRRADGWTAEQIRRGRRTEGGAA